MNGLHKIWMIINPTMALIGLFVFLIVLAIGIHFILLSTTDFNWLEDGIPAVQVAASAVVPQQM
ncbi:MAG: light-harvesting protein [Thiohalocapsa sp.]|jgi:light-harvesting complex 1 alpha chain|uniref:light-harvesting antenna LH1, alpha subunit n=1 Tax=Thiohalocapsa sp. TaxID=2497641 RepID=UPI0025E43C7C|nr:light-harvesting antenna LH1, alpha subunit [Thiohalocapsa sp.]MCG6939962.1 light-harvesting protein [Thiohalocapsa sp.]